MTDLTQPASAAEFIAAGVDATTAANLAAQHNAAAGRGGFNAMAEARESFRNMPPPPTPAAPPPTTNAQLVEAAAAHQDVQLQGSIEATFAPPANAFDYRAPPPVSDATDEQYAADTALKTMLHVEGTPAYIGNAIMADLAANRMVEHNLQPGERTLVLGQLSRMLDLARADPALKHYVADATPEGLMSNLSRETIIAFLPWAQHRTTRR